ncbi:MAG: haloperoxidase [Acidobacteriota bacterium]
MRQSLSAGFLILLCSQACFAVERSGAVAATTTPGPGVLIAWNERLLAAAEAEDGFLTLKGLRTAAMAHASIHDALSAIHGRYRPLLGVGEAPGADSLAATAQAAFSIAVDQYPDRREEWEREQRAWLGRVPEGAAKQLGVAVGSAAAAAILESRRGDGWDGEVEYQWRPMAPGVYAEFAEHSGTPAGFVFGAGWAKARPFVLSSPDQFRSPPPPPIASDAYARAFDEVRRLGAFESPDRSQDETHLALWWKEFVESSHNRLARQLIAEEDLDLVEAARFFALLEMSIYDAYVAVFDNKFRYNHWRPYTAIRSAGHDGNPDTEPDPDWDNAHRHSYAFPSYPSAHGTACAAAMTVFATTFGDDRPIVMTTREVDRAGPFSGKIAMDPPTRSFPSFSAAAKECALSRVYLGIHFRYDSEEGTRLGGEVGSYVMAHALRPARTGAELN